MQVSPAKIKVFLGSIKAKLEDENTTEDPSLIFLTLLKMELLLRGVLVEEDDKVYSQILASAGKALLNESFIPKQLLAGANIIAGRMAESFACNRDSFKPDLNASSASLKRAQEIKDKRFIILLQQDFDALEIARGYFSSATCLSPDTPPMWKKLWDVICAQYNDDTPFQSQLAIENLIRIADLKGNSKRSTELKLKLIQCYLNKDTRDPESGGKKNTSIIFGDVTLAKLPTDAKEVAELAKGVVQEFNLSDLTDSDKILYGILKLRVEMSLESAIIEQMAEDQISNDINRSKRSTIHDVRIECKQRVFARADAILQQVSLELRDSLLLVWSNNNSAHLLLCLEWTKKAVLRLKDRAEVTKKQENWDILYQYILKIIHAIIKKCDWSLQMPRNDRRKNIAKWLGLSPKEEICLVSTIVTIFPTVYWMMLEMDTEPLDEIFRLLDDVLFVLQQQVIQTGERLSSILTSKSKVPTEKTLWKQAQAMVTCFICQDDRDTIFHVTREAVTYKRGECHGVLGVLQCLVAWSGWFQNPWAFCSNISDVRRLLAAARADSGRPLTILEEMLLDLAGADAELLQGGFPKDAGKVYLKVLTGLKMADKMEEGLIVLLRAHCNNGLARVCQLEIDMEGQMSVEEFAQQTLNALDNDHHISRLQIWHKPDTISASFVRKLSTARQLIADYLVMEGRCEEAREFLQAAVNDSPLDSSAAFALGSFLLKMAFYGNEGRSQEADKGAQIQLLKSAKLDSTKSNPFALLGFWFEEQGDIPRAKRCYSKSLALDPCNPVSGRGVLRLGAYEDAQTHIEQAIDENSSQNGWAWQAVGLNKVLRGEDDLAIVALLKALRCRDIIQTSNEPLGIFYQSQRRMINEQASVLEETGHCYRRLGRYTAAIRAFHAAIDSYREGTIPSSVLCSCAQGE
jgi:tetratricopeptide (TPR) repeat protein